jgi:hypothetical protein
MMKWGLAGAALSVALAGCGAQKPPEEIEPALEAYVLESVPGDLENRMLVDFEGKVRLVGYKLEPKGVVAPGQRFKLTMYWKSVAPLGAGWRLFTHVLDDAGRQLANPDNDGPLRKLDDKQRQALSPSKWRPGKVYVDEQELEVPPKIATPHATVTVGIWRSHAGSDSYRLQIIGAGDDGQNRAVVVRIPTGVAPKAPATAAAEPGSKQERAKRTNRPVPKPAQ